MIHYATLVILNLWWVCGACAADRGVKYDRLGRILPSADSKEAVLAQLDIVYGRAQKKITEVKGLSFEQQRTEITQFHEENIKPIEAKIRDLGFDIPYVRNIRDFLVQRLVEVNFNLAMQSMYNSVSDFGNAYEHYIRLPSEQLSAKQLPSLWKAALIHGDVSQIQTLGACATFLPEHADALSKRLNTFSAEEQLSCVAMLLKKSKSFREVLEKSPKKQGEALWALAVRASIVRGEGKKLLDLFHDDTKKIHDQLFMHTIMPFIAVKKFECQKACAYALSTWSQRLCEDDHVSYHSRHLETSKLIDNNPSLKKMLASTDCGVYVSQWWANFHMMLWEASRDRQRYKSCQKEQLLLFKKAESFFVRISASDASILSASDNKARLSMHGAVLSALLDETNVVEKVVVSLCENALKSGLNILEQAYISKIARHLSSAKLLALVQPFIEANPAMLCSLGYLYHKGHQIVVNDKKYWWIEQDLEKAQSMYCAAVYKGFNDALMPLGWLMKNDYEGMCIKLDDLCKKFPTSEYFKIQKASFLCAALTKNEHLFNQESVSTLDLIEKYKDDIETRLKTLSPHNIVYCMALCASYKSVAYALDKQWNRALNTKEIMDSIASTVHTTYSCAARLSDFHDDVETLFDTSVYTHLREYAETLLEKEPQELDDADLQTMAVAGYMICQLFDKNTLRKEDSLFLDAIVKVCLDGDVHRKVPILAHMLAVFALYREGLDQKREQLFFHLKAALQENVSKDDLDAIARANAEKALGEMALDGSVLSQAYLVMHKKHNALEMIKMLAISTKKIIAISKEKRPVYIKQLYECGGYAFLKERLLKSNCADCAADMAVVLVRWIAGITHDGDKSDPMLKPFFDDLPLIKSYHNG